MDIITLSPSELIDQIELTERRLQNKEISNPALIEAAKAHIEECRLRLEEIAPYS